MKNCKVNGRSRKLNLEQAAVANLACAWCISLANGTHSSPVHDSSPVSWHSHMKRACTDLSRVSYVLVGGRERSVMLRSTVLCARQLRRMTIIVFFIRSVRERTTNYGLVTDVFHWPIRCTRGKRGLPQPLVLKLNLRFLSFTLQLIASMLFLLDSFLKWYRFRL